jgi:hypothetical protein
VCYVFSHITYWLASNFNLSALYELVMLRSNGYNIWWRIQIARLCFSYFHVKMSKECWSKIAAISIKWTTNYLWSQIIEHIDQEDVSLWKFRHWLVTASFIGEVIRNTRKNTDTCRKSLSTLIRKCWIEYTSPWAGFKLTILSVIGTDFTGSCKSN